MIRLVGTILLEQDDEWTVMERRFVSQRGVDDAAHDADPADRSAGDLGGD